MTTLVISNKEEKISKALKDRPKSRDHRRKISEALKGRIPWNKGMKMLDRIADKNPAWKGEDASYAAKHQFIRKYFNKQNKCEHCEVEGKTQWSNKTHDYDRFDKNNWQELCISCHLKYDAKKGFRNQPRK